MGTRTEARQIGKAMELSRGRTWQRQRDLRVQQRKQSREKESVDKHETAGQE